MELTRDGARLPLLAHTLANWLQVFARVQVVQRPGSDALAQAIAAALPQHAGRIDWVVCTTADRGMGASLAAGIAATSNQGGWLIGLGDMPAVPVSVIAQVRHAMLQGAVLCAPWCDDCRGHPVGFAARYREELLALDGDHGARELLQRDQQLLRRIQTIEPGVLMDIDTPADIELIAN